MYGFKQLELYLKHLDEIIMHQSFVTTHPSLDLEEGGG